MSRSSSKSSTAGMKCPRRSRTRPSPSSAIPRRRLPARTATAPARTDQRLKAAQAIRAPLLPLGSVRLSSGVGVDDQRRAVGIDEAGGTLSVTLPRPSAPTARFGRSPRCGPSGLSVPCLRLAGFQCGPAVVKSGASQRPTAWRCSPCRPGRQAAGLDRQRTAAQSDAADRLAIRADQRHGWLTPSRHRRS